jgi:hypothetical protein
VRILSDRSRFLSAFMHKLSNAPLAVDPDARSRLATLWIIVPGLQLAHGHVLPVR